MSIQVGVAGAGGISHYHIRGYQQAGAEVVALCDPSSGAAEWTAGQFRVRRTYGDIAAMLRAHPEIQAVSVCTPNRYHAAVAQQALQAGKHVFCEKPPALDAAEARCMADTARAAGVHLMYDFNNRARPESAALMRYIDDGSVGRINSAQAAWVRRCGIPGYGGWFTQKGLSGGGPAIDLLHMLDLALWFMGYPEPAWVSGGVFNDFAHDPTFAGPWGLPKIQNGTMDVETAAHAFVTFKTGQVLYARMSWAEMVEREEVSVMFQGTKAGGRISRHFKVDGLDDTATDTCLLFTHENGLPVRREVIVGPDPAMGRIAAVVNFVETLSGRARPLSNAEEGVKLMQIIDAMYRSAQTGAPVQVTPG